MMGIKEAGSVDIEASSRKTTGKSVTFRATHADVMHVVQIYTMHAVSGGRDREISATYDICVSDDIPKHFLLHGVDTGPKRTMLALHLY